MNIDFTALAPGDGIRWAIRAEDGRRSSTQRVWANKKGDLYFAIRSLGGVVKTSIHRDGRCHTGFTADAAARNAIPNRHLDRWTIPLDQVSKAIQIAVPESELDAFESDEKEPMRWLPAPPVGFVRLVAVVVVPASLVPLIEMPWPGADQGTELVGLLVTPSRTGCVVTWIARIEPDAEARMQALRAEIRSAALGAGVSAAPGVRATLFGDPGTDHSGARTLMECALRAT